MELLFIGVAVAFNLLIIIWKFRNARIADAVADASLLVLVATVFGNSEALLIIGTIASTIISFYLLMNPIRIIK